MPEKYLKLNAFEVFRFVFHLSNYVWEIVIVWKTFAQHTAGEHFVRAADSISANIANGFGRHFKKDKSKFYRYSPGID